MPTPVQRHVVKRNEQGKWAVVKEGHQRASSLHATKAEAEQAASRYLKNQGGGEKVLHRAKSRRIHKGRRVKAAPAKAKDSKKKPFGLF